MPSAFETLKKLAPTVSVGVLTADLMSLGSELALLDQTDVSILHFDVMDGNFCPALTVGPAFIKAVKTPLLKDIHLMITEPVDKLADYVAAGADIVTVHVESTRHVHRALQALGQMTNANDPERGIARGVALNPGTPVETVEPLLDEVDMIALLAVNPGWGGQRFIESTLRRIEKVRRLISESGRDILIAVDGGITRDNVAEVAKMKPDIVVTGSAVFDGKAPVENARFMLDAL
ncbi:MAG: ribulose-phosphate 3-epimerase [Armatimonadota bacterium]|nr:ribulose-phosphate 3-epimerase [Armatimonadota bacterium]